MSKIRAKIKDYVELIGLAAVVASLLFLAFEIQQSNRIAVASTEIGIRNGYSEFNRGLHSGNDVAQLMARAMVSDAKWSPAEELKILMVVHDILNVWLSVETACDNGLAEEATCKELRDDIGAFIAYFPGTRPVWRYIVNSYPSLASTSVIQTVSGVLEK